MHVYISYANSGVTVRGTRDRIELLLRKNGVSSIELSDGRWRAKCSGGEVEGESLREIATLAERKLEEGGRYSFSRIEAKRARKR